MRCVNCGEPWDNDSLHEEVKARIEQGSIKLKVIGHYPWGNPRYDQKQYETKGYNVVAQEFREKGCAAFTSFGAKCSARKADEGIKSIYDLLGDDMDGAESMIEDMEFLGLLK